MRSQLARALMMLLTVALGTAPARAAEQAKPEGGRLRIEKTEFDAGNIVRGDEAHAVFVLHNVGTAPLKILSAKPSCGCTVASFDGTIAPGKTGKVTAALKTKDFRGPIAKGITVTTDDPASRTVQLVVKANVVGSVTVLPRPMMSFPTTKTWEYAGKLLIRKDETESGNLVVTDLATSVPWLAARVRKIERDEPLPELGEVGGAKAGDWVLEVNVAEDAPRAQGSQNVKFKTGLAREPEITIPVSVVLQTPMRIGPSPLVLKPPTEGSQESTGVLFATLRPGLSKETLEAIASPDPFAVTLQEIDTRQYRAIVTWKPNVTDAPREGNVIFRVGEESMTVLLRVSEQHAFDPPPAALRPTNP